MRVEAHFGPRSIRKMAGKAPTATAEEARRIGEKIGIDWDTSPFDVEQFRMGMDSEYEHGKQDPQTNVTDDDPEVTGKIAWAHLKEMPNYYTLHKKMEAEGRREN